MKEGGKYPENLISFSVSPEIVDGLEFVQIKIDEAECLVMLILRAEEFFARAVEPAPVGYARQAVRHGQADGKKFILDNAGQIPKGRNILLSEVPGDVWIRHSVPATAPSGSLTGWPA